MMQLKVKLKSGAIHDMDVEDVLSIDGRPPFASDVDAELDALRLMQAEVEGRLGTLERLIIACGLDPANHPRLAP